MNKYRLAREVPFRSEDFSKKIEEARKFVLQGKSLPDDPKEIAGFPPLSGRERIRFLAHELWSSGRVKLAQYRRRGKLKTDEPSDYWQPSPQIYWGRWYKENQIRIGYDVRAQKLVWLDLRNHWLEVIDRISAGIEEFHPSSVLEMGCGFGRNLIALKKRFPKIQTWYALDYSLNGIAATLANLDIEKLDLGGELICGDFRKTSLPDQSVDYVFSFWSLPYGCIESPQNQEEILAEMLRITRKGILLIEPDFSSHLYGIRKPTGYWDFEKLKSSIKSRGLPFHDEKLSIRMNPFIDVHEIRISLA